jgi:hypothetical protein
MGLARRDQGANMPAEIILSYSARVQRRTSIAFIGHSSLAKECTAPRVSSKSLRGMLFPKGRFDFRKYDGSIWVPPHFLGRKRLKKSRRMESTLNSALKRASYPG